MQPFSNHTIVPDIPSRPWKREQLPRRILVIRLQALGDLVITLPYLQWLRNNLPEATRIDLLTREEVEAIPKSLDLFNKVYSLGGGRNPKKQLLHATILMPALWLRRYQMVIDLQNNIVSDFIRRSLMPTAWSVFDRFSPIAAGDSTRLTIEAAGIRAAGIDGNFQFRQDLKELSVLKQYGWDGTSQLVLINPAGAFPSRNWPLDSYISFMKQWLEEFPNSQFLVMGVGRITEKASQFEKTFPGKLINLVDRTNAAQAFALVQRLSFVLTEDSGMMHMAWVSGIPTLALFGSTRSDRARPLGDHSFLLHSGDLSCGNCMEENCRFGDTHCLLRYSPEFVFQTARKLLGKENLQADPIIRQLAQRPDII